MAPYIHEVASCLEVVVRTGMGIAVFASVLEPREHLWRRLALIALACMAAAAALVFATNSLIGAGSLPLLSPAASAAAMLAAFSALLVACVFAVQWLFDCTPWTALFCCSAGYAIQNLFSGLAELVWICATGSPEVDPAEKAAFIGTYQCTVWITAIAGFAAAWLIARRMADRRGLEMVSDRTMLVMMAVVILMIIGFDILIKSLCATGIALPYAILLRLVHGMCCIFTIWMEYELLVNRHLEIERTTTERLIAERERQYQLSRENIDAINIKCHDLRHQIRQLAQGGAAVSHEALDDIAREVDVYDSAVHTGNEALYTILTEKCLLCQSESITLSVVADGAALSFMEAADIYSFFGNALDNAIEAVRKVDDPGRRSISLVVRKTAGAVSVHVENYFEGTLAHRKDGTIETSKADKSSHGFGIRSMELTAERYGGALSTKAEDGIFHVNALFPPE